MLSASAHGSRRVRWRPGEVGHRGTAAEPATGAPGEVELQALAALAGELEGGVGGDQVHGLLLVWARLGERLHATNIRTILDSSGPPSLCQAVAIDTPARLLRLLVLFSTRPSWSATDLTTRLEVTGRTLRRDVTRLRDLGYPIESTTGRHGGYALGAGGRLPPLLLDDDEAVAVTLGLQQLSGTADASLGRGRAGRPGQGRAGDAERAARAGRDPRRRDGAAGPRRRRRRARHRRRRS